MGERGKGRRELVVWLQRLAMVAGAVVVALPTAGGAQSNARVTVVKSGLMTLAAGHQFWLTVSEVGSPRAVSDVTIEFRDASNQPRGFSAGALSVRQPAGLKVSVPAGTSFLQLRAIVTISTLSDEITAPVVGLEDVHPASLQITPRPPCPVPALEPTSGGGVIPSCGGWHVDSLAPDGMN